MGVAAGQGSHEVRILQRLTALSAAGSGVRVFQPTVVRFGPAPGEVSLMNRQARGWGEFSFTYNTLRDLAKAWRLAFTGMGRDAYGPYINVEPLT